MTADMPATFAVEYDCERRCRVELDCDEIQSRTTLNTLRQRAGSAHDYAHAAQLKVYTVGDATVRALSIEPVVGVLP